MSNEPNFGSASRQGARGQTNDDCCDFFEVDRVDLGAKLFVAVVADGVASTPGAAQASRIAVKTIRETLMEPPSKQETISEWLEYAIKQANEEIAFEARKDTELAGMSTTIVLAALVGEKLYVMHLGDSRAYLIRQSGIYQLTADHTWTQEAIDVGTMTLAEAARHPGRNQLQRYLATDTKFDVDRGIIAPGTTRREEYLIAQPGESVLLCTDGVHRRLSAEEIHDTVLEHIGYPQDVVDELIERSLAKGERDDITAVLLELPPEKKRDSDDAALADSPAAPLPPTTRSDWRPLWIALVLVVLLALLIVVLYLLANGLLRQGDQPLAFASAHNIVVGLSAQRTFSVSLPLA